MDNDIPFTREGLFRRLKFVVIGWLGLALFAFLYDNGIRSVNDLVNRISSQNIQNAISNGIITKISLNLANGQTVSADMLEGNFSDSLPYGLLTLQTSSGEILTVNVDLSLLNIGENNFEIEDYSITAIKLAENSVTDEKIAENTISGIKIIDGTITGGKLTEGIIVTKYLGDNAVTTIKIEDGAITTEKLLDNVVVTGKLADGAVTEIKLANGSIVTGKIKDLAVTGAKIANATVTDIQLADGAVVTAKITDGAITEVKLQDGSISLSKLSEAMCAQDEILKKGVTLWECSTDVGSTGFVATVTDGEGITNSGTAIDPILNANVDNVTIEIVADTIQLKDSGVTSAKILDGTIVNGDISALAQIEWEKISKAGSSLADLATRDFTDILNRLAEYVSITDTGSYFTATDAEGTLQEIGGNFFRNDGNSFGIGAIIGTNDNNSFGIETNGTTRLTVLDTGSVTLTGTLGTSGTRVSNGFFTTLNVNGGVNTYLELAGNVNFRVGGSVVPLFFNVSGLSISVESQIYNKLKVGDALFAGAPLTSLHSVIRSAANSTVEDAVTIEKKLTSGTAAAGLGTGLTFLGTSTTTGSRELGRIKAYWSDAADATRTSKITLSTYSAGVAYDGFTVAGTGNVGIGTTSPNYMLDVRGQVYAQDGVIVDSTDTDTTILDWRGGSGRMIRDYNSINFDTIGTFSFRYNSSTTNKLSFSPSSNGIEPWTIGSGSAPLHLSANSTGGIRIDTTGYIGIGSTAPTAQLHQVFTGTTMPANGLDYIYWNPASTAVDNKDIFTINVGSLGTTSGDIFQIQNNGVDLFSVSQSLITSALPHNFSSPGDVAIGYNLNFTNSSSSFIKSNATMYLQAGEIFNSSDLVARTYNSGAFVFDTPGGLYSMQAQNWTLAGTATSALNINNGLLNFDTQNSRLGIGNTSPAALLAVGTGSAFQINSLGAVTAAAGLTSSGTITFSNLAGCGSGIQTDGTGILSCLPSDASVKQNIEAIESPLSKVLGLQGISYNWTNPDIYGTAREFGLIAQEVELIAPELVFTMGNGLKGVKYNQLTALLIEAIKEQNTKIENIESVLGLGESLAEVLTKGNIFEFFAAETIPELKVKKLIVTDEILASLVNITGEANFFGNVAFNAKAEFRDSIAIGSNNAGRLLLAAGSDTAEFIFSKPFLTKPVLTINPIGNYLNQNNITWWIESLTETSFIIKTSSVVANDIEFNWILVEISLTAPLSYP